MRLCNVDESVTKLAELLEEYSRVVQLTKSADVELEVRFGSLTADGVFVAGVEPSVQETAERLLGSNTQLIRPSEWYEVHDFFFSHAGVEYRQRSVFDTDYLCIKRNIIIKRKLRSVVIPHALGAFRVTLSREVPVNDSRLPPAINTSHVRIQQRRHFDYVPSDATRCLCRYEMSEVCHGATKSEAEKAHLNKKSRCELELEFCDPSYFRRHGNLYCAHSMLLKACDLYSVYEVDFQRTAGTSC